MTQVKKEVLKLYGKFCLELIFCVWLLGFVCPALISMNNPLYVFGFVLLLSVPPVIVLSAWHMYNEVQTLVKGINDENKTSANPRRRAY